MKESLQTILNRIWPVEGRWIEAARERQLQLTKPPESLGRLEEIANRLCAMEETISPSVNRPRILVFAADHGVCEEGVNPYPQAVTAQMVANFLTGGAAINALAEASGIELQIIDAGVANPIPETGLLMRRPVGLGTRNFCREPAMTTEQAEASLLLGIEVASNAVEQGCRLLGIGEMGIGNTTSASALTAAMTGTAVAAVTGRGTGADTDCMSRKQSAIQRALDLHRPAVADPLNLLTCLGGFEIGAMCGVCLGAAANRCAVLVDGFIATAAAALAVQFAPAVRDYLIPAHRSTEPGHGPLLEMIGHRPLLDLEMRLGEGTGAALAVPVVRAAAAAFNRMATFASAGVSTAGRRRRRRVMRRLRIAFAFLTQFPINLPDCSSEEIGRAARWFPLVGAAIGVITAGETKLLIRYFPPLLSAVFVILTAVLVTGALHYDGLADTADGFGGGESPEDILRIMHDHSIGSYGACALILAFGWKLAAIAAVAGTSRAVQALIIAPVIGRWAGVLSAATSTYARSGASQSTGSMASFVGRTELMVASAVTLPFLALQPVRGIISLALAFLFTILWTGKCRRRIGGITGDTLGATIEASECIVLAVFAAGA